MVTNNSINVATAATGKVLQGAGVGTAPAFSTATYPATATTTGQILRADGTNWVGTTATYPNTAGTSGNVLTSDGTNWTSAAPGGASTAWTSISAVTVSTQATITYTSGLTTYNELLIVFSSVTSSTTNNWRLNLSTDGGGTYAVTQYGWQTTGAGTGFVNGTACIITSGTWVTGASNGYIHFINNTSASTAHSIHSYLIDQAAAAAAMVDISAASGAQINAIKLDRAGGNFNAGTVTLYGR